MSSQGIFLHWEILMLYLVFVINGKTEECRCPGATVLPQFPSEAPVETCCLNYSGSSFGSVSWAPFSAMRTLKILDLSDCNITLVRVDVASPPSLREVYFGRNRLSGLPEDFLVNAPHLETLDLGGNLLEKLPEDFLQGSGCLRELRLDSNRLSALPRGVFQPTLERLELSNNSWECSCSLLEELRGYRHTPGSGNVSDWQGVVGNLICASPGKLAGQSVWLVQLSQVCLSPGLTTLFVLLPLFLLLALVLCWCCGRRRRRKEGTFSLAKKAAGLQAPGRNGSEARAADHPGEGGRDALLKNQLMLQPSNALLDSSRDLYEEVEIRLGSEGSLAHAPSEGTTTAPGELELQESQEPPEEGSRADLETVSVTEVMKDSADREKAYLAQTTEYYSLVPGIDLEDSDHAEYESVDLS